MTERERLIELIEKASMQEAYDAVFSSIDDVIDMAKGKEYLANYLLENGVMCPSYKVGDTVYVLADKLYWKAKVRSVWYRKSNYEEDDLVCVEYSDGEVKSYYGREIYFTKEEAEQALKGGAE